MLHKLEGNKKKKRRTETIKLPVMLKEYSKYGESETWEEME